MKKPITAAQELTSAMLHVAAAQLSTLWISDISYNQADAEKQFQRAFNLIRTSHQNHLNDLSPELGNSSQ